MASNYDQIRKVNIKGYGEYTHHLELLGDMYTDRTHFFFEILQNAEDAEATKILFELNQDKLLVKHNGRLFVESDVRAICGIGEGKKAEDLTQIGKFGIGFKSVYVYTSNPEIHSGDENFRIEHYVRPYKVKPRKISQPWTTLIMLNFDVPETTDSAFNEIAQCLRELDCSALLFLKNIKEFEYLIEGGYKGSYKYYVEHKGIARIVTIIQQIKEFEEHGDFRERWLIFERPVRYKDKEHPFKVEIALKLTCGEADEDERVVPVIPSKFVVFFPTEIITPFRFLIQGPFRTTKTRENVPKYDDTGWNLKLIDETAILVREMLLQLKNMNLLNVAFFDNLPIRLDDSFKNSMFLPIVSAIKEALVSEELIPADDGSYVCAKNAILAESEWIRKLLNSKLLTALYKSETPLKWISGIITKRSKTDLWEYLRNELGVEELTSEIFARKLNLSFLEERSDEWFIEFYKNLINSSALWRKSSNPWSTSQGILLAKPFIRLDNGKHVTPFGKDNQPNAFLPSEEENDAKIPIVRKVIANNESAKTFLTELGLTEYDIVEEVVERILPRYHNTPKKISIHAHKRHINKIKRAMSTKNQQKQYKLVELLRNSPFVRAINATTKDTEYKKPYDTYFPTKELLLFFDGHNEAFFADDCYDDTFLKLLKRLGVNDDVRIMKRRSDYRGFVVLKDFHSDHERGLNDFDPDFFVLGLEQALAKPSYEKSVFIWNNIVIPNKSCIKGTIEISTRQTYEDSEKKEMISNFGEMLMRSSWLPNEEGSFHRPSEISLEGLPDLFQHDPTLAELLGMRKSSIIKLAEKSGVSTEVMNIAIEMERDPEFKRKVLALKAEKHSKDEFPEKSVISQDRRSGKLSEEIDDSPDKEYRNCERSIRTSKALTDTHSFLKSLYTNENGLMICQICKKVMPFKKRDGEYYFEAVEVLNRNHILKEHVAQYIALCPLCAAMYKEFVKNDEPSLLRLKKKLMNCENLEVDLKLGDLDTYLRFVESHLFDLKTLLEKYND
jgi:hypothetical protein